MSSLPVAAEVAATTPIKWPPQAALQDTLLGALAAIPGMDHASITVLGTRGRPWSAASTGVVAQQLDHLQLMLVEGPCLEAMTAFRVVAGLRLATDTRWPRYSARASNRFGLQAQLSMRLLAGQDGMVASLNLYSTRWATLLPGSLDAAEAFEVHAGLKLRQALGEPYLAVVGSVRCQDETNNGPGRS